MSVSALSNAQYIAQNLNSSATDDAVTANNNEATRAKSVEFLQLLLIQLENQNPLEPTDTNELTNQLLTQSQLEQQIQTNEKLDAFLKQLEANAAFQSLSYIGNRVEILGNNGVVQNGKAEWSYIVDGTPKDIELTVTDAAGNILHKEAGSKGIGPHNFTLDGTGIEEGTGVFLFINALDDNGESLDGLVTTYVTIDGVDGSSGTEQVTAGNVQYKLSDVLKITSNSFQAPTPEDES